MPRGSDYRLELNNPNLSNVIVCGRNAYRRWGEWLLKLTEEQFAVVNSRSEALRVVAFAGAGKTATLREYAAARPKTSLLYLAFNRSIAAEAQSKFPSNVKCMTTHALAFQAIGKKYRNKLAATVRPNQIAAALGLNSDAVDDLAFAKDAVKALQKFMSSPASSIEEFLISEQLTGRISDGAIDLWRQMIAEDSNRVPMLHDGYLKLYQLQSPSLGFGGILFDEAQDANPVTLEILRRQQIPRVFVGDPHQQIYQFRHAVNALADPLLTDSLHLTESFRFGSNVASVANDLLRMVREPMRVRGGRRGLPANTIAYIARGNAAVFKRAAASVEPTTDGVRLFFAGGLEGYRLDLLLDIWRLWKKDLESIKDPFVRGFKEFDALRKYALRTDERDVGAWINVVETWGGADPIPLVIRKVEQAEVKSAVGATLCLSTAHKSKGLEFGRVELAGDFPDPKMFVPPEDAEALRKWKYGPQVVPALWARDSFAGLVLFPEEELNLQYVAATRAEGDIQTPWGDPPLATRLAYLDRYPEFLRVETEAQLFKGRFDLGGEKSTLEVASEEEVPSDLSAAATQQGVAWSANPWNQQRVDYVVSRYSKMHPQWSWVWVAGVARLARSQKEGAAVTLRRLESALRLNAADDQLHAFLLECRVLQPCAIQVEVGGSVSGSDNALPALSESGNVSNDTSVYGLVLSANAIVLERGLARFGEPGWTSVGRQLVECPTCGSSGVDGYRRPYVTTAGDTYHYWALVCLNCRRVCDRASLSKRDQQQLPKIAIVPNSEDFSDVSKKRARRVVAPIVASLDDLEPGRLVVHHKFGDGVVERKYVNAHDSIIDVDFPRYGLKSLAFRIARLQIKR